jgi:hypothetical protein
VSVFVAENKKELLWKNGGGCDDNKAKAGDDTDDFKIKRAQTASILATREGRDEDVGEEIGQDGEDHGETAQGADLGHGACAMSEEANEEDCDLSLNAVEDGVGRLAADESEHGGAVARMLRRIKVDDAGTVATQQKVLNEDDSSGNSDGHSGVQEKESEHNKSSETNDDAGKIDRLDNFDVRAKTRDHAENAYIEMDSKAGQDQDDKKDGITRLRAVSGKHDIKNGRDGGDPNKGEAPAKIESGADKLAESRAIIPDAAADGNESYADAYIGEQVQRALHGIGDGEIGVLALLEGANNENATEETNELHDGLNAGKVANNASALNDAAKVRRLCDLRDAGWWKLNQRHDEGGLIEARRRRAAMVAQEDWT